MGAKTQVTQAPTLTPEQKALLDSQMRGVMGMMQGFNLGAGWGGPSFESYNPGAGYGGKTFDMSKPATGSAARVRATVQKPSLQQPPGNPMFAALQSIARIPSAAGQPGAPGLVNPASAASYSNRENLVAPVVNPFRRNLGG